jgi:GNAT superfamily N-acetyltransferase
VIPPADAVGGRVLLQRALAAGEATAVAAVVADVIVGLGLVAGERLLALGVAPAQRGGGLAGALLDRLVRRTDGPLEATVTVAERDPIGPLPRTTRAAIARRLLDRAGFDVRPADGPIARIDPEALVGRRD